MLPTRKVSRSRQIAGNKRPSGFCDPHTACCCGDLADPGSGAEAGLRRKHLMPGRGVAAAIKKARGGFASVPENLAPRAGFEPATNRLTAGCSTTELPGNTGRAITNVPQIAKPLPNAERQRLPTRCIQRLDNWRPRPELNRGTRFCRPLRNHSATWPLRAPHIGRGKAPQHALRPTGKCAELAFSRYLPQKRRAGLPVLSSASLDGLCWTSLQRDG